MSIGKATQASTSAPELAGLTLGFVPLLDAALLIIAREGGFFSAQGLDVSLSRENAWSTLRDKVAAGLLDGAHMLAPMPLAMSLGLSRAPCETLAAMVLGRQGNTLVLSQRLANALDVRSDLPRPQGSALALRDCLTRGLAKPRLAMVYPYSCQHLLLREWLSLGAIDSDSEVELVALPPPRMVDALREGEIDGFCVGEPWGSQAEFRQVGKVIASGADMMPGHPEKVLGVTASWARRYPHTLAALIRALRAAASWLDSAAGARRQALEWLSLPPYLDEAVAHLDELPVGCAPGYPLLSEGLRPQPSDFYGMAERLQPLLMARGRELDDVTLETCYSSVHHDEALHQPSAITP
ncbi:ABC transporter substrate-binding protein [Halomonas denitrificans]|uniref:CmpA/NrtA family ABC transporter substrate-binding protein n=1 Tax=Halomonas TaxID=2745 RepID=UPI001C94381A|nr:MULTISPECIES: CmpA/NrtA family ABC transporter substrate-binding protein [Halomonas]MBY6029354.1 ABC transporter substrate-binding protein [Halomonas sp. DP8Y7-1]MCA0974873.1 ABC transporter substrate-binding protein [Halomonas denitrificans]MED5294351.1 CmpA/NrtA family ABC transporter substrate-binding protein [Pseudomonadota bacterium]